MLRHYQDKMLKGHEDKGGGNTFVIIASGPSLTPEQVNYVRGKAKVIVINDNYKLAPWADYLYFCDQKWFNWHKDSPDFKDFKGQVYTQEESASGGRIRYIKSVNEEKMSVDPDKISQGSNSGYQAINLAYHLGAKRIILLGYDMQPTGGKRHWFGDHRDKVESSYPGFIRYFNIMAPQVKELGLEVINCTAQTALTCFEQKSLEEVL